MQNEVFTRLVDAHYTALYRFAFSLARNASDAADLTQQTFYTWATKGHGLRDAGKAKTWLFTTLYREFLRQRRRSERVSALDDQPPGQQDPADDGPDFVTKLDSQLVLAALQDVDSVFRAPLTLFYLQELSYQEIAEIIEVPIGTVMSRLSRGKSQLRELLKQRATEGKVIEFPVRKTQRQ